MSSAFWQYFWIIDYALALVMIVVVLRRRKEPAAMMAWILVFILIPFVGSFLYILIGDPRIRRQVRKRERRRGAIVPGLVRQTQGVASMLAFREPTDINPRLDDLVRIATRVGHQPPTRGNDVTPFTNAERTYLAIRLAIESARSHVHMEYYIFQPDDTGRVFRDLLIARSRQGVKCRLLLDGVGSWTLSDEFIRPMRDAGVEVEFFLPVRLQTRRLHLNLRNHRKLVVCDGGIGFLGSQNIGDEYLGRKRRIGPWRDTHLRVEGPATAQLQEVFVEDWHFATRRDISSECAMSPPARPAGDSVMQIVASGPDRPVASLHMLLLAAVATARHSIAITTPYFVPDTAITLALQAAAVRGVHVQILLPSRSDVWLVLWAGRSYYRELVDAGVEIYEYADAILHSKMVVVDESWSMVGSANMDIRSFRLNFELTALIYDEPLSKSLYQEFSILRSRARRVPRDPDRQWSLPQSVAIGVARLASPLL